MTSMTRTMCIVLTGGCHEDSRRGIPIARGKIEIAAGNEKRYIRLRTRGPPSFRHRYFFFSLDFARASRPLSVLSHFIRGTPDTAATGKKSANFYNTKALGRIVLTAGINRARLSPAFSRCAFLNYGSNCDVNAGT